MIFNSIHFLLCSDFLALTRLRYNCHQARSSAIPNTMMISRSIRTLACPLTLLYQTAWTIVVAGAVSSRFRSFSGLFRIAHTLTGNHPPRSIRACFASNQPASRSPDVGCWRGPVLEPRLKPSYTLLYDLVYLSFYMVDDQRLTNL